MFLKKVWPFELIEGKPRVFFKILFYFINFRVVSIALQSSYYYWFESSRVAQLTELYKSIIINGIQNLVVYNIAFICLLHLYIILRRNRK